MTRVQYKTPGVFVQEIDAFPPSIVGVDTAVPVFIGYTERAERNGHAAAMQPVRITSMAEYVQIFGGAYRHLFKLTAIPDEEKPVADEIKLGNSRFRLALEQRYDLYNGLRLFYANGGGNCYVVSAGAYGDPVSLDALFAGLNAVRDLVGPTLLVIPETVLLVDPKADASPEYDALVREMLKQCGEKQDRVAIIDVWGSDSLEVFSKRIDNFRSHTVAGVDQGYLSYGMAYAPYLHTSIVDPAELSPANFDAESQALLPGADVADLKQLYAAMAATLGTLPPSAAMAGIYTQIDNLRGVWNAPANVGLVAVTGPAIAITNKMQEDLNTLISGLAINAIRDFVGRGTVVWGARTLDGNSNDWRYIQVRRAVIYIEQSVELALNKFVFEPNVAQTWVIVASMIGSFLRSMWQAGGLSGATPQEAFSVQCGLGSTMTPQDVLEGRMIVQIKLAVVHPAEFIILTFQQQMQGGAG